jgi:T-complex protein 1 subunit delta
VDLRDIRIVKKVGGTIDDTELVDGVVLNQNVVTAAGGPTRMEKAKIAIIQFQLSAPKPDVPIFSLAPFTSSYGRFRWTTQLL